MKTLILSLVLFFSTAVLATDIQSQVEEQAKLNLQAQKLRAGHWADFSQRSRQLRQEQLKKADELLNEMEKEGMTERGKVDFLLTHMLNSLENNWEKIKTQFGVGLLAADYGISTIEEGYLGHESEAYFFKEKLKKVLLSLKSGLNEKTISPQDVKKEMFEIADAFYFSLERLEFETEGFSSLRDINETRFDLKALSFFIKGAAGLSIVQLFSGITAQDTSQAILGVVVFLAASVGSYYFDKNILNRADNENLKRWKSYLYLDNHYNAMQILGEATTAFYLMEQREKGQGCIDQLIQTNHVREQVSNKKNVQVNF